MLTEPTIEVPAVRRVPGSFYRPELDILRFGAFLLVFESHTFPLQADSSPVAVAIRSSGALGVPLFLLLSAFLITELLLIEKRQTATVNIKAFYVRRILRIWPLYFAAILSGFVLSHLPGRPHAIPLSALAAYMLLVGNLWTAWHMYLPLGLAPLWSISLEEQYYLVWPSLVKRYSGRIIGCICVAVWLFSQVAILLLCARHASMNPMIWPNTMAQFQYFALGSMLSLVMRGRVPNISGWGRSAAAGSGLALFFIANYAFRMQDYAPSSIRLTYLGYLITGPAVVLLLLATLGATPSRRMGSAIWLGKRSYGLYVFHQPILFAILALGHRLLKPGALQTLLTIGTSFFLTVGVAFLSYRYFESPFLRIKERFEVVRSRAV